MPLELIKEKITLDAQATTQSSQLLLEGDILVPDSKPDIDEVLRCGGEVSLTETKANTDRVSFSGELAVSVLYAARGAESPIQSVQTMLPIEDFVMMPGVTEDSSVSVRLTLSHLECQIINDRKIGVRAVIDVLVRLHTPYHGEIVTGVENLPQMQTKIGTMKVNAVTDKRQEVFHVTEQMAVPAGKPDIGEILYSDVNVAGTDVRMQEGRMLLRGNLKVFVMYLGNDDRSALNTTEYEIPFNGYIETPSSGSQAVPQVRFSLKNKDIQPMTNEDGEDRLLDVGVTVMADVEIMDHQEIDYVEDAYIPGRIMQLARERVGYLYFVGRNQNQYVIRETLVLDETQDPMLQVGRVWGTVALDDINIRQDVVEVQGVITLEVIYVGENDDYPISVATYSVPFLQEVELMGAQDYSSALVEPWIEDITFTMLSDREMDARITLGLDTLVVERRESDVITDMEVDEEGMPVGPYASAVVYVIQPGDTLWEIAKRYDTTLDEILLLNDFENPDLIYPGERILILRWID